MLLGNLFEHYDTALYSLLSPFLAPLFFPTHDPLTALILTYCIIPLGMIARPFGSLVFGYIGDTRGRREALFLSLSGMACVTLGIGCLPTYAQAGIWSPLLLSLGRLLQNFLAAGETVGGAIFLMENSQESEKDLASGWYNASTVAGILLASFGVSLLCVFDVVTSYWRLLYLAGSSTALFAFILRIRGASSLATATLETSNRPLSFSSLLHTCCTHWRVLVVIALAAGFSYASYMVALVMINGFVPLVSAISKEEMSHLNTVLLFVDFLLLPLFAFLAHRFSREKMMIVSSLCAFLLGAPLFLLLQDASLLSVLLIRIALVMLGVWFSAPFYAWAEGLVPASSRYTVLSLGYALGSQLLGGPTAALSLASFKATGWIVTAALYWMTLGLVTSLAIQWSRCWSAPHNSIQIRERSGVPVQIASAINGAMEMT